MRSGLMAMAIACALAGCGLGAPGEEQSELRSRFVTLKFTSDTGVRVTEALPDLSRPPAFAQRVCLNKSFPPNCPMDATLYGSGYQEWTADLSAIPGAKWIWAPGVDGSTMPADLAHYRFTVKVPVQGRPLEATMWLASDDLAVAYINDVQVGSVGSITNPSTGPYRSLTAFDIADSLHPGENDITVDAQNGPAWFSGWCNGECSYAMNPAGVVFGGTIVYDP